MAKSIQQIKQELDILEQTVAETATQLQITYDDYLDLLGKSVQKQLVLAGYYICTQVYPESFLQLTFSQRQKLQQKLRELGKQTQPEFKQKPSLKELKKEQADLNLIAEMLQNLPLNNSTAKHQEDENHNTNHQDSNDSDRDLSDLDLNDTTDVILESDPNIDENNIIEIDSSYQDNYHNSQENLQDTNSFTEKDEGQEEEINFSNPQHLILWQKQIEKQIKQTLDNASQKANRILQDNGVIPSKLPTKIMDIALQNVEGPSNSGRVRHAPNILNLVIEAEKEQKNKKTSIGTISLLRLRLGEIEFADTNVSNKRNEIRVLLKKIGQIRKYYQETKHQQAIAEADAAWRSSWYED